MNKLLFVFVYLLILAFPILAVSDLAIPAVITDGPTVPQKTTVNCGDTITTDTVLENDLLNCSGNGLIIAADNIALDCNGHRINGDYDYPLYPLFTDSGIYAENSSYIKIKNCNISGFREGIALNSILWATVTGNSLSANHYGVFSYLSNFSTISNNSALNNVYSGFMLSRSSNVLLSENDANGNRYGVELYYDSDNEVVDNSITYNEYGIYSQGPNYNKIISNTLRYNWPEGITILNGQNNLISGNHVNESFRVLSDSGTNETIRNNVLRGDYAGTGLSVYGFNSTIEDNYIVANYWGAEIGGSGIIVKRNKIYTGGAESVTLYADYSEISENNITAYDGRGISLIGATGNLIWNNIFIRSGYNYELLAYEDTYSTDNDWNSSAIGNFWSDFADNSGYPLTYVLSGPGDGVDYHPMPTGPVPPVLSPFVNITVNEYGFVRIVANAYDPNGDALAYSINSPLFTQNGNVFTWRTGPTSSGGYNFMVNVTDGTFWDSESVHVTVRNTCKYFDKKHWCWDCRCPVIIAEQSSVPTVD